MSTENLPKDFAWVKRHASEYGGLAGQLRNVATLNPSVTKREFVAAAEVAGYHKATAQIQFDKSRRFDLAAYDHLVLDTEGRLLETSE